MNFDVKFSSTNANAEIKTENADLNLNFTENSQNIELTEIENNIEEKLSFQNEEKIPVGFGETTVVYQNGTFEHDKLKNRDYENQHPIKSITGLSKELESVIKEENIGSNLSLDENKKLNVLTTNNAEEDNTKPLTSAGAFTILGNIDVLLKTI